MDHSSPSLQPTVLFFVLEIGSETAILLKITAALVFFYRQSSNRSISVVDGGSIAINSVSLSIFTTFLLEISLEKHRLSNSFYVDLDFSVNI